MDPKLKNGIAEFSEFFVNPPQQATDKDGRYVSPVEFEYSMLKSMLPGLEELKAKAMAFDEYASSEYPLLWETTDGLDERVLYANLKYQSKKKQ